MKRLLTDSEKLEVRKQQSDSDGILRCFISGQIIGDDDHVEYDHIQAFSKDGETSLSNVRIVLKELNRRKSADSLYDVRDNLRLERLFQDRKNNIRLQDIFELKDIEKRTTAAVKSGNQISIDDGATKLSFPLYQDGILDVPYFYGRIPICWLENDDQEGLQPRVIDYKRLIAIRDHLKSHPQLAPSIARLLGNKLKLFDGQHKLAAQVLNNQAEIDIKVYVSPTSDERAKRLFDGLMITNLEAHSKLKQVPFYTSTLLDRLSVIYKEMLDEFISDTAPEDHSEECFVRFLSTNKSFTSLQSKDMLRSAIKVAALESSELKQYVAAASKDASYPLTMDLLEKTIFRACLYLEPSSARFTCERDHRNAEAANFAALSAILVAETGIANWVTHTKGKSLSNEQLKARRIWHKGSVLTWAPYLKSILFYALHCMTSEDREHLLHRPDIDHARLEVIRSCLKRLFAHPMWDDPDSEIDSLLVSARKQEDLFNRKGLTEKYVIYGEP
ncbi:hypothetical protein [Aquisediminimonas sediminicola]|uniref:hypothetical protein n=1 Tax=Alteraquisediminimonas sediminicola TaxID=2676787 RepID=UPI001C8D5E78|nr:hypothetical protein [Aquisediminimonas sediminicola]